jgi:hypothetical protein
MNAALFFIALIVGCMMGDLRAGDTLVLVFMTATLVGGGGVYFMRRDRDGWCVPPCVPPSQSLPEPERLDGIPLAA